MARADDKTKMEAIFEIFDSDNDGLFNLNDLITVLRTFEKFRIVPKLAQMSAAKHLVRKATIIEAKTKSRIEESHVDNDDFNSDSDIEVDESEEEMDEYFDIPAPLSSKLICKTAREMFQEAGFDDQSELNLEEFIKFLDHCKFFKDIMLG